MKRTRRICDGFFGFERSDYGLSCVFSTPVSMNPSLILPRDPNPRRTLLHRFHLCSVGFAGSAQDIA